MTSSGQVLPLRYVNVELTPLYRGVIEVFFAAKQRFVLEMRVDDLLRELPWQDDGPDRTKLEAALQSLIEWGNLARHHDTSAVTRISDFYKKQFVYHLTAVGEAAHRAVLQVEATIGKTGALQTQMLRRVHDSLKVLAGSGDATARFRAADDLLQSFKSLAEQATHFIGELGPTLAASQADEATYQHYKAALIDYLTRFLDDLQGVVPEIAELIRSIDAAACFHEIVPLADLPPRADGTDPRALWVAERMQQWRGIRQWFVDPPPTVDRLREVARHAVLTLARTLGRLHERRTRRIDRGADFRLLGRWFAACSTDEDAHALACAAFGMHSSRHMHIALPDEEVASGNVSWWDAPAAAIPVRLRTHGTVPRQGRPGTARDFSDAKTWLRHRQQAERRRLEEATALFVGRTMRVSDLPELTRQQLDVFLDLIDQALTATRRPDGSRSGRTLDGALEVTLLARDNDDWVRLASERGDIVCRDYRIEVRPVSGEHTMHAGHTSRSRG